MKDQDIRKLVALSEHMLDTVKLRQLFLAYLSVEDFHKNMILYGKIVKQSDQMLKSLRELVVQLKSNLL